MLRIRDALDVEREFGRRRELSEFAAAGPVEISPPEAIYESPGGDLSKDFLPELPPAIAPPKHIYFPEAPEYITTAPPATRIRIGPKFMEKMAPEKNLLDRFFDWLNKILSGK